MGIEQLVDSAARGDERAWASLARYLGPKLRRWFASNYGGLDDDDLIQDTLIVIWDKLPNFEMRGEAPFMRWVFKIARFTALAALRELGQETRKVDATVTSPRTPSMGANTRIDRAERLELVRREVDRLPESLRLAATNMLDGGETRELADHVGLRWGTIRGYESRAASILRHRLGPPTPPS